MMKHNLPFFHPRNISNNHDGGLDFCRFLESGLRSGRSAGSFPQQWLVIEPTMADDDALDFS